MRGALKPLVTVLVLALVLAVGACGSVGTQRPTSPVTPSAPPSASPTASTPVHPRSLTLGMQGSDVRQFQLRLTSLHYYPGKADGQFGQNTLEALWAFQAIQGLPTTGRAGPATRQALERPRDPQALVPAGGKTRVEVDLSRQVLVLYRAGQIALITHISSGGGYYYCSPSGGCGYAVTPTGDFAATAFMPGWVTVPLGEMYDPVFFIGTSYAIHGSASVPLLPVSHGCVRIPMSIAEFFHNLVPVPGTPVYIRR